MQYPSRPFKMVNMSKKEIANILKAKIVTEMEGYTPDQIANIITNLMMEKASLQGAMGRMMINTAMLQLNGPN